MKKEAEPIIRHIKNARERTAFNKTVIEGTLFDREARILICGVGKVNAACGTQYLLDCGAEHIINVGTAGALNGSMKVGDIVNISRAVQYDFDLTQLNGTEIGTLDECTENYIKLACGNAFAKKRLATGDRFNDSKDDFNLLTEKLFADVRDMEGCAAAQVCMHARVKFCAYKVISDVAGNGSTTEQFLKNLEICFDRLYENTQKIILDAEGAI